MPAVLQGVSRKRFSLRKPESGEASSPGKSRQLRQAPLRQKHTMIENPVAVAEILRVAELMRAQKHRNALLSRLFGDQPVDRLRRLGIQPAGRFIKEKYTRPAEKSAGQRKALRHTGGIFARRKFPRPHQVQLFQKLLSPVLRLRPCQTAELTEKQQIVQPAELRIHPGALCHHPTKRMHLLRFCMRIQSHYRTASPRRCKQPCEQLDRRGFPCPVRAEKAEYAPLRQGKRKILQRYFLRKPPA